MLVACTHGITPDQRLAHAEKKCAEYGLKPDSPEYKMCVDNDKGDGLTQDMLLLDGVFDVINILN